MLNKNKGMDQKANIDLIKFADCNHKLKGTSVSMKNPNNSQDSMKSLVNASNT